MVDLLGGVTILQQLHQLLWYLLLIAAHCHRLTDKL